MDTSVLPTLNACLNALSACLLTFGYIRIRRQRISDHRAAMIGALVCSALFLCSYLVYHIEVGSVPYPHHDWTRPIYFAVLIPHIILAVVNLPFILAVAYFAFRGRFERHRKLARWVWPSWRVMLMGVMPNSAPS